MPPLFKYYVICSTCKKPIDRETLICPDHGVDHGIMSPNGYVNSQTVYLPGEDFDPNLTMVIYAITQIIANLKGFNLAVSSTQRANQACGSIHVNMTDIEWLPVIYYVRITD